MKIDKGKVKAQEFAIHDGIEYIMRIIIYNRSDVLGFNSHLQLSFLMGYALYICTYIFRCGFSHWLAPVALLKC